MSRTLEEIIALLEDDLRDIPVRTQYDEGFTAGIMQTLFLLRQAAKEANK